MTITANPTIDEAYTIGSGGDYATWGAFLAVHRSRNLVTDQKRLLLTQVSDLLEQALPDTFNFTTNDTYYIHIDFQGYRTTSIDTSLLVKPLFDFVFNCKYLIIENADMETSASNVPCLRINGDFSTVKTSIFKSASSYAIGDNGSISNPESGLQLLSCIIHGSNTGLAKGNADHGLMVNCTFYGNDTHFQTGTGVNRYSVHNTVFYNHTTLQFREDVAWPRTSGSHSDVSHNAGNPDIFFGTNNVLLSSDPFNNSASLDFTPVTQINGVGKNAAAKWLNRNVDYTNDITDFLGNAITDWSIGALQAAGGGGGGSVLFPAALLWF